MNHFHEISTFSYDFDRIYTRKYRDPVESTSLHTFRHFFATFDQIFSTFYDFQPRHADFSARLFIWKWGKFSHFLVKRAKMITVERIARGSREKCLKKPRVEHVLGKCDQAIFFKWKSNDNWEVNFTFARWKAILVMSLREKFSHFSSKLPDSC